MAGINDVLFGSDVLRDQQIPGLDTAGVYKEAALSDAAIGKSRVQDAVAARDQIAPPGAPPIHGPEPAPTSAPTVSSEPAVDEDWLEILAKDNPTLAAAIKASRARMSKEKTDLTAKQSSQEAQAEESYNKATDLAQRSIDQRRADYAGIQMPQRPDVQRPAPVELPKPPSMALRPFGSAKPGEETFETLNRVLSVVGLLGQEAVGIQRGFARGALSAYEGALQGWADGDKTRAQNQWLDYTHQVDKLQADHKSLMDDYNDAWDKYGHDMETLRVHMGIIAAQHGLDKEQIDLAFSKPQEYQRRAELTGKRIDQLNKDTDNLETKMLLELARQQAVKAAAKEKQEIQDAQLVPGGAVINKEARYNPMTGEFSEEPLVQPTRGELRENRAKYGTRMTVQEQQMITLLPTAIPNLNRLEQLTDNLLSRHSPANLATGLQGHASQKLANDPDWLEFQQLSEDSNIEMAAALSRGQLRSAVLQIIRDSSSPRPEMTRDAARRRIELMRQQIANRVRTSLGQNVQPVPPGAARQPDFGSRGGSAPATTTPPPGWKVDRQ